MYYNAYMKNEIVTFDRDPNSYKHWELLIDNNRATIFLDVAEKDRVALLKLTPHTYLGEINKVLENL